MNLAKSLHRRLARPLTQWPVESQQVARRNAMIASTALAQRRAERDEVEEFLAALTGSAGASPTAEVAAQAAL